MLAGVSENSPKSLVLSIKTSITDYSHKKHTFSALRVLPVTYKGLTNPTSLPLASHKRARSALLCLFCSCPFICEIMTRWINRYLRLFWTCWVAPSSAQECGEACAELSDNLGNPHHFGETIPPTLTPSTSPGAARQAVWSRNRTPGWWVCGSHACHSRHQDFFSPFHRGSGNLSGQRMPI